jgi:hypothetical protein
MDNQQVKTNNFYWTVGFMDGEGSFIFTKSYAKALATPRYQPAFKISGTDFKTLLELEEIYKEHGISYHIEIRKPTNGHKPSWMMVTSGYKRMFHFLSVFTPECFRTKSEEAFYMFEFIKSRINTYPKAPYTDKELELIEKSRNKRVRLDLNDYTRNLKERMV